MFFECHFLKIHVYFDDVEYNYSGGDPSHNFVHHRISVSTDASVQCQGQTASVQGQEGILSSHVTDETGCGSTRSPWVIAAMPGQTIELSIIDFGSELLKRRPNDTSMLTYGYITDGDKRIQITGDIQRERKLYASTTDEIMIEITPGEDRYQAGFIIQYKSTYFALYFDVANTLNKIINATFESFK